MGVADVNRFKEWLCKLNFSESEEFSTIYGPFSSLLCLRWEFVNNNYYNESMS